MITQKALSHTRACNHATSTPPHANNGTSQFSSLEPEIVCRLVWVRAVDLVSPDGRLTTTIPTPTSATSSSSSSSSSAGVGVGAAVPSSSRGVPGSGDSNRGGSGYKHGGRANKSKSRGSTRAGVPGEALVRAPVY